jgi:arginyl-tRNA synthetase
MTKPPLKDDQVTSPESPNPVLTPLQALREEVLASTRELTSETAEDSNPSRGTTASGPRGEITLERPPRAELGDYSTNAALLLASGLGMAPREVAQRLGVVLERRLGASLERFEVAGPGFLNLFMTDAWLLGALEEILTAGEAFGAGGVREPERVLVEFVSANPTGPMHVGHARNAAYGDALARVLDFHGHMVDREFYVNDAGSQVRKLGESIGALARGEAVPDDGYHGDYVESLVVRLRGDGVLGDPAEIDPDKLGPAAVAVMISQMQASLHAFAVRGFDHWQYESELHSGDPSPVAHTLAILEEQGHTYRSEGALWLRTTDYGDDKDRVLVRSSGEHTYFASDIAYHQSKRERGFERQIDVWGADHHGYLARMKAAYAALGGDPEHLEMLTMQLVHLMRAGERTQMSKRAGEFVTLDDLVAEIGVDAARWFLLSRSHDTTIDLDLDLARAQSSENPVYYVQYGHARASSILAKASAEGVEAGVGAVDGDALHVTERALIKHLLTFPLEVAEAAARRGPHRIAAYALELTQSFTAFYRDCRVVGVEPASVASRRVALCVASRSTIARCLELLGVEAPQEM